MDNIPTQDEYKNDMEGGMDLVKKIIELGEINDLKNQYNLQVQYLCCDNAGENVAFKKAFKQEGLGIDF